MSSSIKTEPSIESQVMLETLKPAVAHALDKKRRLGQYAVVWKNGKPIRIAADSINIKENDSRR